MDKYEYRLKTEEMLRCVADNDYKRAEAIADGIDWRRIKSVSMLCAVSDIYDACGRYSDAREILFIAFDRASNNRKIIFGLTELAIKTGDLQEARDCYDEYVAVAPHDANKYVLEYELLKAEGASIDKQIKALEEFKKDEYSERWAYELAKLYEQAGMTSRCISECDDIFLWFTDGKYVRKALELKRKYRPLSANQTDALNGGFDPDDDLEDTERQRKAQLLLTQQIRDQGKMGIDAEKLELERMYQEEKDIDRMKREERIVPTDMAENDDMMFTEWTEPEKRRISAEEAEVDNFVENRKKRFQDTRDFDEAFTNAVREREAAEEAEAAANAERAQVISEELAGYAQALENELPDIREIPAASQSGDTAGLQIEYFDDISDAVTAQMIKKEEAESAERKAAEEEAARIREEENKKRMEEEINRRVEEATAPLKQQISDLTDLFRTSITQLTQEFATQMGQMKADQTAALEAATKAATAAAAAAAVQTVAVKPEAAAPEIIPDQIEAAEPEIPEVSEIVPEEIVPEEIEADEPVIPEVSESIPEETSSVSDDTQEFTGVSEAASAIEFEEDEDGQMSLIPRDIQDILEQIDEEDKLPPETAPTLEELEYDENDFEDDIPGVDDDFVVDDIAAALENMAIPGLEDLDTGDDEFEEEDSTSGNYFVNMERRSRASSFSMPTADNENAAAEGHVDLEDMQGGLPLEETFSLEAQGRIGTEAGLTEDQKNLFSYFVPVRGMSEQLVDVLRSDAGYKRSGTSACGNILVMGASGSGKTVLAVDVVKAIQKQRSMRSGKIAIIDAEALNKKDIPETAGKIRGGALIIESAGKLSENTVHALDSVMEGQTDETLFVLEDQKENLEEMLSENRSFADKFNSYIEVPVFINDELVTFGQSYAHEHGFKIEEMGILALYSRIDIMQREDHAVTVAEVKDIMDSAFQRAKKNGMRRTMTALFKKNEKSELIPLREDDFAI